MIDFSKIHRFSFFYHFYKLITDVSLKLFYREIHVLNKERVPKDAAVIFAPNHQNALMDALAILSTFNGKTFFLARADLFAKDRLAKILRFMCIMPVFRIRDGYSSLNQNDKIIGYCTNLLKLKKRVTIMPEGNHDGFRRLRPLKKGIPRVAFHFAETTQFKQAIYIVPVGLDFSHYWHIGAKVTINFGEPIDVLHYQSLYEANPAQALLAINQQLRDGLKKRMLHIESERFYDTIDQLREIAGNAAAINLGLEPSYRPALLESQKHLVEKLDALAVEEPAKMQKIEDLVKSYTHLLHQYNFRDNTIERGALSTGRSSLQLLLFTVGFPIYLIGAVVSYPSFKLPMLAIKKIKDVQFWSSVTFVLGMLISVLIFLSIFIAGGFLLDSFSKSFTYAVVMVLCGAFALRYSFNFKKMRSSLRFTNMLRRKHKDAQQLIGLRTEIISLVNHLLKDEKINS